MDSSFKAVHYLGAYHFSFLVLAGISLVTLIQKFATASLAFVKEEQVPGLPVRFDHSKLSFRVLRAHANSVETFPAFGWALLVALLAGASSFWLNRLAGGCFIGRITFWFLYHAGIGIPAGGSRIMAFLAGLLCSIGLAAAAIWSLLQEFTQRESQNRQRTSRYGALMSAASQ